jgi:predicted transcriptional regulator
MDKIKRKRERLEMIFDILTIIRAHQNSIKPTPLLRQSNLSSQSFTEYLNELLEKDLIKEITDENERKSLTLTDKGFSYLDKYKLILGFIEEFEL